ncbi:MAG: ATP-dependent Clp protease proteolytic subunit, partial [Cyanobacteriota bacterium]|nr:ATP-dependent Clp protease proteolytic subunit [Cyanobacteriota bacterium]
MIDALTTHPIHSRWTETCWAAGPMASPGVLPTVVEQSGRGDR